MIRVAIIGAGMAGLTLAHALDGMAQVRVFEKSRGYGGRMATRRAEPFQFDHGAQFFTAKSESFEQFLAPFVTDGSVARWDAEFVEYDHDRIVSRRSWRDGPAHYVAVPGMNRFGALLADGLDVVTETRIAALERESGGWRLRDQDGHDQGGFDWVVLAIPAAQVLQLLPATSDLRGPAVGCEMLGCYSLMLGFEDSPSIDWQAAFVSGADISWVSLDSSKPGRPSAPALLVHSTNRWAQAHLDDERDQVIEHLQNELTRVTGLELGRLAHVGLHRWLYANIGKQSGESCYIEPNQQLALAGDWCVHGRIEAAFLSARELAHRLKPLL